jgi:hypothetical protein
MNPTVSTYIVKNEWIRIYWFFVVDRSMKLWAIAEPFKFDPNRLMGRIFRQI